MSSKKTASISAVPVGPDSQGSAVVGALLMGWAADIAGLGPTMIVSSLVGALIVAQIRYRRWRKRRSSVSRNRDLSDLEKGRPPPP